MLLLQISLLHLSFQRPTPLMSQRLTMWLQAFLFPSCRDQSWSMRCTQVQMFQTVMTRQRLTVMFRKPRSTQRHHMETYPKIIHYQNHLMLSVRTYNRRQSKTCKFNLFYFSLKWFLIPDKLVFISVCSTFCPTQAPTRRQCLSEHGKCVRVYRHTWWWQEKSQD